MNELNQSTKDFMESIGIKGTPIDLSQVITEPIEEKVIEETPAVPCPVCGCAVINQIRANNGICGPGYYSYVVSEYCANCGVMLSPNRKKRTHS